jgi:anti-sigma factor (TIGR02949 family)
MSCREVQDHLEVFLTQRLSAGEQESVRRHLVACGACAHAAESTAALKALVKNHAMTYTAPPEVRAQVVEILRTREPAPVRSTRRAWGGWRWAAATAGLGVVMATVLLVEWSPFLSPQQRLGTQVLTDVVQMHRALVERQAPLSPLELDRLNAQLQASLGFVPTVSFAGDPEVHLVGGELTHIAGQQAEISAMRGRLAILRAGNEAALGAFPALQGTRGPVPTTSGAR